MDNINKKFKIKKLNKKTILIKIYKYPILGIVPINKAITKGTP